VAQVRCAIWREGRIACGFHLAVQMKLGFTLTLVSNVCVKSSNHMLTIRLPTNIAKIKMRHNSFGAREKAKWKAGSQKQPQTTAQR
jgi:hypothetical protein